MLKHLSREEFLTLAKTSKRVSIYREISADRLSLLNIVENLKDEMQEGSILESGLRHEDRGRYSFIGFNIIAQLRVKNKVSTQYIKSQITTYIDHPFVVLRKLLKKFSCANNLNTEYFQNSVVGFLSYDAVRFFENIPDRHKDNNLLPELFFNFYQNTLVFDHIQQKLLINIDVDIGNDPEKTYQETQEKISMLITKINTPLEQNNYMNKANKATTTIEVKADINDTEFMTLVDRAKQYIINGDAFQIVLSRCFIKQYTVTPFEIYRTLRRISPAPYMFYLPVDNSVIIGASPEKLISVRNKQVETHPIAGSRPRTEKSDDNQIASELLNDSKEVAEHMMLVDLARNDIGAVCQPGSVKVKELLKVKHFSHISHMTSTVTGKLCHDKDALDALAAVFPAGTLSGAPKIRAMEIIDELENSKRGLYGGAICRLDYQGNLDSCIAIRMAVLNNGIATVRAGGGIVYDSDPKKESDENRQKAKGILEAIRITEENLS